MKHARAGFTLVELLVVIVIIGMLIGLLVPAVISARERARQGVCTNRLKELGTAAIHYASIKGQLPGWRNKAPLVNDTSKNVEALSWAVTLFPYLGREDLWQDWRAGTPGPVPVLFAELTCPSDSANNGPCTLNYVANTGLDGEDVDGKTWSTTTRPNLRDARWGVFHDRYNQSNPTSVTLEYLSQHDGATICALTSSGQRFWPFARISTP
ncbi:MAG: DUF1559 domain-containing protein [Patescibacteria group bacterium]|nr:DUF1559 domain-containing protein [Patescibacteria group bacterium]